MSHPPGSRFTVAALLESLTNGGLAPPGAPRSGDALVELLGWFRTECAAIVAECSPEAVPLRLPKARIGDLLSCERGTLGRLGRTELTEPIVRGRLTDLLVAQHVTLGLPAVGGVDGDDGDDGDDAIEDDLVDGMSAAGDTELLAWLGQADDEARARLRRHVGVAAHDLRSSWGDLPRSWWPRAQQRVSVDVADGALILAAQFDLVLGGAPTGRPAVIIEVKAGAAADRHRRDLLWYGLLWALRHDQAPAVVATWTAADGGLVPVAVTTGALEAAARRGLAALERLVGLANGREPAVSPHPGCAWCPELDRCPPGLASLSTGGTVGSAGFTIDRDADPDGDPTDEPHDRLLDGGGGTWR